MERGSRQEVESTKISRRFPLGRVLKTQLPRGKRWPHSIEYNLDSIAPPCTNRRIVLPTSSATHNPLGRRNTQCYYDYQRDYGHSIENYFHLKKDIESLIYYGQLKIFIKDQKSKSSPSRQLGFNVEGHPYGDKVKMMVILTIIGGLIMHYWPTR